MVLEPSPPPLPADANYDETKVTPYRLPDPLVFANGARVTAEEWPRRRLEIVALFEEHVFGVSPEACRITAEIVSEGPALDGMATRREVQITLAPEAPKLNLLLFLPRGRKP